MGNTFTAQNEEALVGKQFTEGFGTNDDTVEMPAMYVPEGNTLADLQLASVACGIACLISFALVVFAWLMDAHPIHNLYGFVWIGVGVVVALGVPIKGMYRSKKLAEAGYRSAYMFAAGGVVLDALVGVVAWVTS